MEPYLRHVNPVPVEGVVVEVLQDTFRPLVLKLLRPSLLSTQLSKHLSEGLGVLKNLHVSALIWEIFRREGREHELPLNAVKRVDLPEAQRRTWEILEREGDPSVFLSELRGS